MVKWTRFVVMGGMVGSLEVYYGQFNSTSDSGSEKMSLIGLADCFTEYMLANLNFPVQIL